MIDQLQNLVHRIGRSGLAQNQPAFAVNATDRLKYAPLIGHHFPPAIGNSHCCMSTAVIPVKQTSSLIFREKLWQNHFYPELKYNEALCTGCGKCVSACPVQRLELKDERILIGKNGLACIHCTQCVHVCPVNALYYKCDKEKWNKLFKKAVSGKGPLPSNEKPKSAVYPLELPYTIQY